MSMSKSLNRVMLIGNVGKQPELKITKSNKQFLSFSMATTENYHDANHEWKKDIQWHNIKVWTNPLFAADKINRGDLICIEGSLKSYEYEGRRIWEVKTISWRNLTTKQNDDQVPSDRLLPAENVYPQTNVGQPSESWNK